MYQSQKILYPACSSQKPAENKTVMEHRQGRRHQLNPDVNVDVYKNNKPLGPAKIRDISPHGAFLKIDPWRLTPYSIIKIILTNNNKVDDKIIQKGMVIHRSSEGAGLMFLDNQLVAYPSNLINMG
jgi:hypothetical protein